MHAPHSFEALGTTWWIEVWDDIDEETAGKIFDFSSRFCQTFNNNYSRFDPNSQISRLNTERQIANPSEELRDLLATGIDLYRRTRGVFNMLTGHILEARGYDSAYSFIDKGSDQLEAGNPLTDLSITTDIITLVYGNVDLGGYGKGYCIDLLTTALRDRFGLEQFLINGGGDMYVTYQVGEAVEIHLQDPHDQTKLVGSTLVKNRAFAASSPHLRRWLASGPSASGAQHNHIVSKTSAPLKDIIYLTAPSATDADAFATTLLQVDDEIAKDLAEQNNLTIL